MDDSALDRDVRLLGRVPILAACRDGPVSRTVVADRAGCSRATAYRATTELEERGLLERVDDGYRLTGFGRTALDRLAAFRDGLDGVRRLRPVLERVDAPELREHADHFADATVVEVAPDRPDAVDRHVESIVADATERRFGVTRAGDSRSVMVPTGERTREEGSLEWVFARSATEGGHAGHDDGDGEGRDDGDGDPTAIAGAATYVVDAVAFEFGVYDDTVVVAGTDEGVVVAVATTDDPDAVAWARAVFERHRARGDRLT